MNKIDLEKVAGGYGRSVRVVQRGQPPADQRAIYSALRLRGFVRTYRSQSENNPHIYERKSSHDGQPLVIDVQLWPDGKHRVSHMWGGYGVVPPTDFSTASELPAALDDQLKKVHLTQKHVRKVRS